MAKMTGAEVIVKALKEHGVTSLNVGFLGTTTAERVSNCDKLNNLIAKAL